MPRKKRSVAGDRRRREKGHEAKIVPPTFSHTTTLKNRNVIPVLPYGEIKKSVMGGHYELSLLFSGDRLSRRLNRTYRGADTPANVLAFPLSPDSGEIVIGVHEANRGAPRFKMSRRVFIGMLFIHGLLHLKGYAHGRTMEKKERAVLKSFGIKFDPHAAPSSPTASARISNHKS